MKHEDAAVRFVRRVGRGGLKQVDLARAFGIAQSHVSRIIRKENWK